MDKIIFERPKNLLEALIIGWTLVYCNLKCRNDGRFIIIRKGLD